MDHATRHLVPHVDSWPHTSSQKSDMNYFLLIFLLVINHLFTPNNVEINKLWTFSCFFFLLQRCFKITFFFSLFRLHRQSWGGGAGQHPSPQLCHLTCWPRRPHKSQIRFQGITEVVLDFYPTWTALSIAPDTVTFYVVFTLISLHLCQ